MSRVDNTVFISYRRANASWALAIFQNLSSHGWDVFFDFDGINSGDFEQIIIDNIKSRAHFILILTPSALERCDDPEDWLRREIETALDSKRNIVPILLDGFRFQAPEVVDRLNGKLSLLSSYNAMDVPISYFSEAMDRLRNRFLNVALEGVLHPASNVAIEVAKDQQALARAAPPVTSDALARIRDIQNRLTNLSANMMAESLLNKALESEDIKESLRLATESIHAFPEFALAYQARAHWEQEIGDAASALRDLDRAIEIDSSDLDCYEARSVLRREIGNLEGAARDYEVLIKNDKSNFRHYFNRALVHEEMGAYAEAISDLQEYLALGGGDMDGDGNEVEMKLANLARRI